MEIIGFSIAMTTACFKVVATDPRDIAGDDHGIHTIVIHDDPGSEGSHRARLSRTFNTADMMFFLL